MWKKREFLNNNQSANERKTLQSFVTNCKQVKSKIIVFILYAFITNLKTLHTAELILTLIRA